MSEKTKSNALDRYQEAASRTANHDYPTIIKRLQDHPELIQLNNFALGAAGEAGEIADIIKKIIYHGHPYEKEVIEHIVKECGDELWYIANLSRVLNAKMSEVATKNIEKLKARYPQGFSEKDSINRTE